MNNSNYRQEVVAKDELSLAEAAKQVSDQLEDDEKMRNSQFNKFMHKLQGQELSMDKQQVKAIWFVKKV